MLVAESQNKERCMAWITEKSERPFFCPECKKEVVLKKGVIKAHHFSHKPQSNCIYGTNESQKHLLVKRKIYEALNVRSECSKCELERHLKGVRPDVSLYIGSTPVAIEIQNSSIPVETILNRMVTYSNFGIYVLWIMTDSFPPCFFHENNRMYVHRIKKWEDYIYSMYYERLYYWKKDTLVSPCHFNIVETERREYVGWGRDEWLTCSKPTKTLKEPNMYKEHLDIVTDFVPYIIRKKRNRNWLIQDFKILIDNTRGWW